MGFDDFVLASYFFVLIQERLIAKNQNTFAKRKREMEKKEKAEAKRIRRTKRKLGLEENPPSNELSEETSPGEPGTPEEEPT